jgi:hypothetical protein
LFISLFSVSNCATFALGASGRGGRRAWPALRAAEQTQARLRWQSDLTADRVLDSADALSGEFAGKIECGSADFLHVVAARRMNLLEELYEFWTCDAAQAVLAKKIRPQGEAV